MKLINWIKSKFKKKELTIWDILNEPIPEPVIPKVKWRTRR